MAHEPTSMTLHDLPDDERPRERLLRHGPAALSSAELLAIILRTGTAQENVLRLSERLLSQFNGLHGLAQASPAQLEQVRGLGAAKTAQLLAAIELGRRVMSRATSDRPLIQNAADAVDLLGDMMSLTQEHVRVILLDSGRRVIATPTIYIGTVNASVLRVPEIFREAIARNSPAIILAHNHPSGDPAPSPEDVEMTRVLNAAARLLDIALIDHIIIGQQRWESLRTLGLGFD